MDLQSDVQDQYYKEYWKKIEDYISSDSKKLEQFFRMYLAAKLYNLPNKTSIYRDFVEWVKSSNIDVESLLKDIVKYADAYNSIYRKEIKELDSAIRDSVKEFRRIPSEMPAPALMELYILYKNGSIKEKTLNDLIQLICLF